MFSRPVSTPIVDNFFTRVGWMFSGQYENAYKVAWIVHVSKICVTGLGISILSQGFLRPGVHFRTRISLCLTLGDLRSRLNRDWYARTNWCLRGIMLGIRSVCLGDRMNVSAIECAHVTSSNSQILNQRAPKGFIPILIYICLQLSSSIASFVWKPAHFEFRSYGDAWHEAKNAFVE